MDMMHIPANEYFQTYLLEDKKHEIVTTPINYFNLANKGVMVYDNHGNLLNANMVFRAGISEHHKNYVIWFHDGEKRIHLEKVFSTYDEAEKFLETIFHIRK